MSDMDKLARLLGYIVIFCGTGTAISALFVYCCTLTLRNMNDGGRFVQYLRWRMGYRSEPSRESQATQKDGGE